MKIIGTNEEVGRFLNALWFNTFYGCHAKSVRVHDEHIDKIHDGPIGTYCGVKIDVEIQEKPIVVGMIMPQINCITNLVYIAEKHGGLSFATGGIPNAINEYSCKDKTKICCFKSFANLLGYRLDELWMESLPSDWDEFDLCISSVMGKRENIHFFKELKINKEAQ